MINWPEILDELNIPYWTTGKNVIAGGTCIQCPCCDDHSHHGNLFSEGGYKCWRCNGAAPVSIISRIAHIDYHSAQNLINKHTRKDNNSFKRFQVENVECKKNVDLPGSETPLPIHIKYLESRGLDWKVLKEKFGIKFTGMGVRSNGIDVGFRIIIPVFGLYGDLIAWQARDVTGKSPFRYIFPKVEDCISHYKNTLYGADLCKKSKTILVVEGVFDCWKLALANIPAVCTFGTSTKKEQIALMAGWENIIVAFDNEPEAQRHADEIAIELASLGRNVFIAPTDFGMNPDGSARDFGDLSMEEIYNYREDLNL